MWKAARKAIVVAPTPGLRTRLHQVPRLERVFARPGSSWRSWLRALRLHQWAKNLLILIPAITSHHILEPAVALSVTMAFVWFGLCASGTYIINDLLDLDADRSHPRKYTRPFAAGELPLLQGILGAGALVIVAFAGAASTLGADFVITMLLYLCGTLWYSCVLKRIAMVDVLALAGLYTVRIIAGGVAAGVSLSFWLLAFSMFLFLSLALVKRYTELRAVLSKGGTQAAGRGYNTDDLPLLLSFGTSAGLVSVLVLALYVNDGSGQLYQRSQVLWLLCPLVLYWICRVWRKTYRRELNDDPVVFAVKDRPSLAVAALCGA